MSVSVVDLSSGTVRSRDDETLTLDLPSDFDRSTGGVFVNADQLGRYRASDGATRVYSAAPTQLSSRSRGEECLVASEDVDSSGNACVRRYWRSVIEPG